MSPKEPLPILRPILNFPPTRNSMQTQFFFFNLIFLWETKKEGNLLLNFGSFIGILTNSKVTFEIISESFSD